MCPKLLNNVRSFKIRAGGVNCVLIKPRSSAEKLPLLIYFHGGAFCYAAAPYHYANAKTYCREAGCSVLMVDYPLSTSRPLTAITDSCLAVYRAALSFAEEWGCDGSRIAVGGDSAGGFLAAHSAFGVIREGLPPPVFAFLVYPVVDCEMTTPSMAEYRDTPVWNAVLNSRMWQLCGKPEIKLLKADPAGFPPAYIETAEFDCLRDEGAALAQRLSGCGVEVEYYPTKGTVHGYDIMRKSPVTKQSLDRRIQALKRAFKS